MRSRLVAGSAIALLVLAACSGDDSSPAGQGASPDGAAPTVDGAVPGSDAAGGGGDDDDDGSVAPPGSDAGEITDASTGGPDASSLPPALVHYIGRFDTRDAAGPRFAWPGSAIVATFTGTGVD